MPHCSYSQHVTLRVSSQTGLVLDIHTHIWSEVRAELRNFEGALIFLRSDWWISWSSHVSEAEKSVGGGEWLKPVECKTDGDNHILDLDII